MAKTSSTTKAARLAQKGGGQKIRFQGGSTFPLTIAAIVVIGIALVIYSRASVPDHVAEALRTPAPIANVAYGFNMCGDWYEFDTADEARENGRLTDPKFADIGVSQIADGTISVTSLTATLDKVFDATGITIDDGTLTIPEGVLTGGETSYVSGTTKCGDEVGTLSSTTWTSAEATSGDTITKGIEASTLARDGSVVVISFLPEGTQPTMPPSAANLTLAADAMAPTTEIGPASTVIELEPVESTVAPTTTADS